MIAGHAGSGATDSAAGRSALSSRAAAAIAVLLLGLHLLALPALAPSASLAGDSSRPAALRINPNTAGADHLMLLPGVGPKIASYIIEFREAATETPAFRDADDLDRVRRIGPATVEKLRPLLRFD